MISRLLKPERVMAVVGALGAVMLSASQALAVTNFTLSISGSTTVFPSAVDVYNNVYFTSPVGNDVAVTSPETAGAIAQPGSGCGIRDIILAQVDIANASRPLKASDNTPSGHCPFGDGLAAVLQITDLDSWVVGKDGITIIVNTPSLGATQVPSIGLQVQDLAKIYSCQVTAWNQINAAFPSVPIDAFSREVTSGTYGDFLSFLGITAAQEQGTATAPCFGNSTVTPPIPQLDANHNRAQGNPGMQSSTQNNNNAVAYVALGFADATNLTKVPVGGAFSGGVYSSGPVALPAIQTIDNQVAAQNGGTACSAAPGGCYPFGRQLFMNTIKPASLTKAGVPAIRRTNSAKALAFVNAAAGQNGQQQFVNEGEAGLTTLPCTPNPACTNTTQNGVTAGVAVPLTPVGGGATQQVNPQHVPNTDVNMDRSIDITDVVLVGSGGIWQSTGPGGSLGWIRQDVNQDGVVDITDIVQIGGQWQVTWQNWVL